MLNRETFYTDPAEYRLANQGVAKTSFPPTREALETLRGELTTFVCDGAYANGLGTHPGSLSRSYRPRQ